jgi:hypothetical protein
VCVCVYLRCMKQCVELLLSKMNLRCNWKLVLENERIVEQVSIGTDNWSWMYLLFGNPRRLKLIWQLFKNSEEERRIGTAVGLLHFDATFTLVLLLGLYFVIFPDYTIHTSFGAEISMRYMIYFLYYHHHHHHHHLLREVSFPWYFSWTNGAPHHEGVLGSGVITPRILWPRH